MPTVWTGTIEERIARLERSNRRCDGNSRRCAHAATTQYELLPAAGKFNALPDGEAVVRRACSRHKQQFANSGSYLVRATKRLDNERPPDKPHPNTIY